MMLEYKRKINSQCSDWLDYALLPLIKKKTNAYFNKTVVCLVVHELYRHSLSMQPG